ncbi:lamin tail domain-containing protein [Streptomyces sp. NPDC049949]|uniref:lamin tail domain-containing protein n=1 Tax=Streptomyces sp. NPDC049949 TaxID=3154627 RepID=UPI0034184BEF
MSCASSVRRIAATVLAAGAVVGAAALPAAAHDGDRHHQQRPRVEISRVQADSPGHDDRTNRSLNNEWVEITNTTRDAINLRGWTLRDSDGNRYRLDNIRINARATLRIHTGTGHNTRTDLFQNSATTSGTTAPTPRRCAMTAAARSTPSPGTATTDRSQVSAAAWTAGGRRHRT